MKYLAALTCALVAAAMGMQDVENEDHVSAIKRLSQAIARDPTLADAYNQRGSEHFKLGHIKESIADFDAYLKLKPNETPGHWKRGISYYYAGEYDKGRKQFEGYEKVDTNDVENAVWRYLCMAPVVGVDKARADILKIGNDRRIPMMKVYELFSGKATPEDVLAAVREGQPGEKELNSRLFYAHQYLGLFFEALGDKKKALEHMEKAVQHKIGHYMWDVANVHVQLRKKK